MTRSERYASECRHYTGALAYRACKAGVVYTSVRDTSTSPYRWPCSGRECATTCSMYEPWTPAELAAREAEVEALIAEVEQRAKSGQCVHCGAPVEQWRSIGVCVYAEPCGHRQGQHRRRT